MLKTRIFKKAIISGILIFTLLLAYFLLFLQYFQQDEWHSFGIIQSLGIGYITLDKSILELLLGDRVGARLITFGLFNAFNLNPMPYGVFALTMHVLNTYLVFSLTNKLTKQSNISLLASFFFLINELGSEAYSWFGTMAGSLPSVFFFLLSLIFFLRFIETKKIKFVLLSTFLLWFSFLFKETAGFAFIFYPILFIIYSPQRKNIQKLFKNLFPFILLGTIMFIYFAKIVLFISGDRANYVNTGRLLISTLIVHSFQYPLEGIVQVFFPNAFIFIPASFITIFLNPSLAPHTTEFDIVVQNKNSEIALIALLIIITSITVFILKHNWNKISVINKKALFSSFTLLLLSFLPFIVIYRPFSFFDSRHYYIPTIGGSILLATFLYIIANLKNKFYNFAAFAVIVFYLFLHTTILFSDFKLMADRSKERQGFIKQVENLVPVLQKKTVFFITGDSEGYYGLPELKTPFQSGLGHILMVEYTTKKQLNSDFFKEATLAKTLDVGFLYDILGQGYREVNGQGFGYYFDKFKLNEAIAQKLFEKSDVISLFYNEESKKLKLTKFP